MKSDALIHDHSWVVALHLLEVVEPILTREEERAEALARFLEIVKAGIESYHAHWDNPLRNLRPSEN